jgi:acyl carrier protein
MSDESEADNGAEDFFVRVRTEMASLLRIELERVQPDARLAEDLRVDSLDFMAIILGLERAFGVEIPDVEAARLTTVRKIMEAVHRHSAPGSLAATTPSSSARGTV